MKITPARTSISGEYFASQVEKPRTINVTTKNHAVDKANSQIPTANVQAIDISGRINCAKTAPKNTRAFGLDKLVYKPRRNELPAVSTGISTSATGTGAEPSVLTMCEGARRSRTPERIDCKPIHAKNSPPNSCNNPSSPGCAAISADIPASDAVSHTAIPAVIPAVHHSPARTECEATRIT